MVRRTLDRMARGGIYDQIGGGFHRYAVDAVWLVPHFEKMLYDNAQLARAYLAGYQAFGDERYRRDRRGDAGFRGARDDRAARAASTRPRMRTPRATRACSTSGPWTSSTTALGAARTPRSPRPGSRRPRAATSKDEPSSRRRERAADVAAGSGITETELADSRGAHRPRLFAAPRGARCGRAGTRR